MELALKQLVSLVLVPYVRSGVSVPALAVDRIDCIVSCLPQAWGHGGRQRTSAGSPCLLTPTSDTCLFEQGCV